MAWPTPRTWVAGEMLTASLLNTHLRDSTGALRDGSLALAAQAPGDWMQASSASQWARVLPYTPLLHVNTTVVGNVGGGEDDLMTYALPVGLLGTDGWGVRIRCEVLIAAYTGYTVSAKLYFGATQVAGISANNLTNTSFVIEAVVFRTGATAQVASGSQIYLVQYPTWSTPAETLANAITIRMTGQSGNSVTDDVKQRLMMVELLRKPA